MPKSVNSEKSGGVTELTYDNTSQESFKDQDYIVINFYDESSTSRNSVETFEQSNKLFEQNRKLIEPSVAFAQVNVELYPDLAWAEIVEQQLPVQIIFSNGMMKTIEFAAVVGESYTETAKRFTNDVQAMTGTYLENIECEQIEQLIDENVIAFVVFAPEADILAGGSLDYIHKFTTFDRFSFPEQPILFFYNTDEECKEKRQFKSKGPAIALYVQKDTLPYTITEGLSEIDINELFNWLSMSISLTKMQHNRRSNHVMSNLKYNSLVYIMPDRADQDIVEDDWIASMMVEVSTELRAQFQGTLAIISQLYDPNLPADIPQISLLCEATAEQAPGIWLVHSRSEKTLKYSYPLEKNKINVQMILTWARSSSLKIEKPLLIQHITDLLKEETVSQEEVEYYQEIERSGENDLHFLEKQFSDLLNEQESKVNMKEKLLNDILEQDEL